MYIETTKYSHVKEWRWTSTSHHIQKSELKMDQRPKCNNLNVMCFLTRKHRSKFLQPWVKKCFLRCDTKNTSKKKKKIDILDLIKILNFCTSKDIIKKVKIQPTKWGKYLQISIWQSICIEIIKNLYSTTIKRSKPGLLHCRQILYQLSY